MATSTSDPTDTGGSPEGSEPAGPARRRPASGTVFVLVCVALAVAFVAFLVFVSPRLLERTLSNAPPPAPQVVASGEVGRHAWTAEAVDATAGQDVVSSDGIDPIVEPEPCLRVDVDGESSGQLCVERLGGSFRGMQAVDVPDGGAVVYGIVAPRVAEVQLESSAGTLTVEPSYVDYGFPLGFFAVAVDEGTSIDGATALDRAGEARASATCRTALPTLRSCTSSDD